ncbi:hypothetical protein GobsT_01990 [Gemmata obscuriglobus]|uniref:TIGR03067 domain-containing protein n=1 Tax=Gemmata obscuriglobus TaxID=114 RepID=A0A2Z3H325_9BACT|nr:TIGR03067 domain-containing protein [Gemmata obscuriglobus]AWM41189.1 TIGR03067 domain-containing protein [Gemmata obscuriglobus]QEG25473.1 hypothetical protein GobsT_01990 [Gemmata obscuriglobus]VTR98684.1 Uncharacterized protein OS=Rhodopirellula maiorica SM1 GN=RMSM_07301 PE=4 SV=1 [Gemmata obscuriglobus UQM 2246]
MRCGAAFVLVVALCVALRGTADDKKGEKPLDPELKKLQGRWELTYHETAGQEDTKECKWVMVVDGDRWTVTDGDGGTSKGTLRLDPAKKPKQLTYTITGADGDQEFIGIYELDGDTYKTCDVAKGKERPTEFATKEETGQVAAWKRVKVKD